MYAVTRNLEVRSDGLDCSLVLAGEIDLDNAEHLARTAVAAVGTSAAGHITVDLAGVTFMDAAGLGVLVAVRREATRTGRTVTVMGCTAAITRLLGLCGLGPAAGSQDGCP